LVGEVKIKILRREKPARKVWMIGSLASRFPNVEAGPYNRYNPNRHTIRNLLAMLPAWFMTCPDEIEEEDLIPTD
jgi:hypothetical protein